MASQLNRSTSDAVIAGVVGGLAAQWDIDSTLLRILYVVGTLVTGLVPGLVVYLVLYLIMD